MNLIFTYPAWFILLCILCGAIYAGLLYYRDKKLNELSKRLIQVLAIIRFVAVFLIAFLLLEPLFESTKSTSEKPIIVFAQDNSESILFNKDSSYIKKEYVSQLLNLKQELSDKYEVAFYHFGSDLIQNDSISFTEKETDISTTIKQLNDRYYNRNLGAIVLGTDGIYNKGTSPLYPARTLKNIPVYTISLGDTTPVKDVYVEQAIHNRLAYRGNDFPVEVIVKATDFPGNKTIVKIEKGGTTLTQKEVTFKSKEAIEIIPFQLEAKNIGLQKYTVTAIPLDGEYTTQNNIKNFYIDVLESKQKVLILGNSPHPDIGVIKRAIETNKNYEATVKFINDFDGKVEEYSLAILHNLPSNTNYADPIIKKLENKKTSILFVLGSQTFYRRLNDLNKGLSINYANNFSDAQGVINTNFTAFKYSDHLQQNISKFPPVKVPFSQSYKLSNSAQVFAYQKIGLTKTDYPLIVFNNQEGLKTGFLIGEGFFRWKYFDYLENENNKAFNELITQMVQYLAAKEDKSFFRVYSENDFKENQPVFIEAEVYNKSYELDNTPEVSITIKNEEGKEFIYNFSKTSNRYELKAGILQPGNYTYIAKTTIDSKPYKETGEFSVTELRVEQTNLVANHNMLYNISDLTGGNMYSPRELSKLKEDLLNRDDLVNIIYTKKEVDDFINLKYLFFIILILLGLEWFLRKRNGAY